MMSERLNACHLQS